MEKQRIAMLSVIILIFELTFAQQPTNSQTRSFINNAQITQVNRDWNVKAEFRSGLNEFVSFFPVEAIDLKTMSRMRALQMDMSVDHPTVGYLKSSWIDFDEISEFIYFIEQYVVPNIKDKTENKQSTTYIFNSKEIQFNFCIGKPFKRISIYLKDSGITDYEYYFWTETQVNKISELLEMLKKLK